MLILSPKTQTITLFLLIWVLLISLTVSSEEIIDNKADHMIEQAGFIHQIQNTNNNLRTNTENNESLAFMLWEQYIGNYENLQKQKYLFDYIKSASGTIQAALFKSQQGTSALQIDTFEMILFDPIYHDQRAVRVAIQLDKMVNRNQWNDTNGKLQVSKYWKQRVDGQYNISNVTYSIRLQNIQNKNPKEVRMYVNFEGAGLNFIAQLNYDDARFSTLGYCLYVSAVVIIQILSAYFLLRRIDTTRPNIVNKISLTTMAICNIQDFYLTMIHIQYIMTSGTSTYLFYIMPSLCYITLFVVFDMKLLFLVWRSHYMREIDSPQALRKKLTTFYIKFYVGLFIYLTLTYFFSFDVWMIIIQNLILLPQIIYNARIGNNPGFQPLYAIGYIGARFLIPFYERACPSNHFMLTPIVGLVVALIIIYSMQVVILFLQGKIGPRFFIPKMMQPDYYDYAFKIKPNEQNKDLQCSICLQNFFVESSGGFEINASQLEQPIMKQKTVMRTPCNHLFHRNCLASWTDVKLECPSCRAPLPPL